MRLLPDGSIEFDKGDLDDVLAAQARMKAAAAKAPGSPAAGKPAARVEVEEEQVEEEQIEEEQVEEDEEESSEQDWEGFMEALAFKPLIRRALRLVQQQRMITMPDMIAGLGVENAFAVSGVISGVTKSSSKYNYAAGELIESSRGPDRVLVYAATMTLLNAPEVPE